MKRVVLVGFMGCGKSTLGKKLANRLNIPFIDSDAEIEQYYKKSIGDIFSEYGESHFREIEKSFIKTLKNKSEFVLATGGGMPCFGENMSLLNEIGTSFYLQRSPKELVNRLMNAKKKRPLLEGLTDEELTSFVETKLSMREEYYRKATFILDRTEQTVDFIQQTIHLLHPLQKN